LWYCNGVLYICAFTVREDLCNNLNSHFKSSCYLSHL